MRKPDFLLIGAAKAGTSSVAAYLNQHPDIYFSPLKEPNFFALKKEEPPPKGPASEYVLKKLLYNWSELDEGAYYRLFKNAAPEQAAGEGSVRYLYFPNAPQRIQAALPDVRLVAILREPVGRLYSHYNMNFQQHLEPLSLDEALEAEPDRISDGWGWDWHYAAVSRYAEQLDRYLNLFGRERLQVVFYEDLLKQPQKIIEGICAHIGVAGFEPDMSRQMKVPFRSRFPRFDKALTWPNPAMDAIPRPLRNKTEAALGKVAAAFRIPAPKLDVRTRSLHAERFKLSNEQLSDLLGMKLPW